MYVGGVGEIAHWRLFNTSSSPFPIMYVRCKVSRKWFFSKLWNYSFVLVYDMVLIVKGLYWLLN
jgi:hypothetical protein